MAEATKKDPRGGHVGQLLDRIEAEGPGRFAQEDQFLVKRALRTFESEGGIEDRHLLNHLRKIADKYYPGGNAPPPPAPDPRVATLTAENEALKARLDAIEAKLGK